MKVATIVGARPQFIKAAAVSRVLRKHHQELLIHTGQHYDYEMSGIFFDGLALPRPDINLAVGSKSHGAQTGAMLQALEDCFLAQRPDCVLIYGDTNSTLAGALAAAKLKLPVAHVESGLRSFNRNMPEEINRVVADHLSNLLFCPSEAAVRHLATEGIMENVHLVGDVMLDVLNWAKACLRETPSEVLARLALTRGKYILVTLHRSENTDDPTRLTQTVSAINSLDEAVVFPVHPRTLKAIAAAQFRLAPHVQVIDPVGYLEMVTLVDGARMVLTDSGGLQKEAYWLGTPCLTMREETEWVETVDGGWNQLVGSNAQRILGAVRSFIPNSARPILYGDGCAAERCVRLLASIDFPAVRTTA